MTYNEICTRILYEAQRGGEKAELANLNTQTVIESIMPSVLQDVAVNLARSEEGRSLLRRTHAVTMTNGVGTLPPEALTQCKWGASIADPDDVSVAQLQSLVPYWQDFVQPRVGLQSQIPWWTVKGNDQLHYIEIGADYDPADGFDGDLEVTIASVPEMPTNPDVEVDWPFEIQTDVIDYAANMLRGAKVAA